jgi:glutathione S-transferase
VKLYTNPASPFARKCRVLSHELGLKLEEINVNARDDESLRAINPLKKIPALVLDDGSTLFDSPVICEYLNEIGGGKFFSPPSLWKPVSGRWKALGLQALGDGIMDAAVACRYETIQAEDKRNPDHIVRYMATIHAGLDALERGNFSEPPTIGEITAGCALGYLDFSYGDLVWRATHPMLAACYAKFSQYPSMLATAPDATKTCFLHPSWAGSTRPSIEQKIPCAKVSSTSSQTNPMARSTCNDVEHGRAAQPTS